MTQAQLEFEEQEEQLSGQLQEAMAGAEIAIRHISNAIETLQQTVDSGNTHRSHEYLLESYIMDLTELEMNLQMNVGQWRLEAADIEREQQQRAEERGE